jgi:hypothetical protein
VRRAHGDVAHDDELVVALLVGEGGELERRRCEQLLEGVRHPAGGLQELGIVDVLTEGSQQLAHGGAGGGPVDGGRPGVGDDRQIGSFQIALGGGHALS